MKTVNSLFTFHNVSINSKDSSHDLIMKYVFTFHNVSINSNTEKQYYTSDRLFTFHNVSINSNVTNKSYKCFKYLHSIMYLLIRSTISASSSKVSIYIP